MKQRVAFALLLVGVVCVTGCMENAILLKVNKDGTGTVTYRIFMSDQLTGMMESMGGMAGQMGGAGVEMPELDMFGEIKTSLAEQFGETAKLESSRELKNKKGWKGLEAIYSFTDVTGLNLGEVDPMQGGEEGESMGSIGVQYAFAFEPGDPAVLTLKPVLPEGAAETGETESGGESESSMEAGMEDMMGGMSAAMMAPMLQGMRVSMLLLVNGEIVESNASFPSKKHPNVFTLTDIAFDKIVNDPKGAKLLQSGQEVDPRELANLDIEGVRMEDPTKELVISFK